MSSDQVYYDTDGMRSGAAPLDQLAVRAAALGDWLNTVTAPFTGPGAGPGTASFGSQIQEPCAQMVQGLHSIGQLFQQLGQGVRDSADQVEDTAAENIANVPEM